MAALRHGRGPVTGGLTARTLTDAEQQARRRHGHQAPVKGRHDPAWREAPVNGRPVRWYVYRGDGPFADEEW